MKTSSFINRRFNCLLRSLAGNKKRFTAFRYSPYIITIIILLTLAAVALVIIEEGAFAI
jgi:hypothetical protein